MTETELLSKLKEKHQLADRYEREAEGLKDQAKSLQKKADNIRAEAKVLLFGSDQTELPLGPPRWQCTNCSEIFEENPGETHPMTVPTGVEGEAPREYICGPVVLMAAHVEGGTAPNGSNEPATEPTGELVVE